MFKEYLLNKLVNNSKGQIMLLMDIVHIYSHVFPFHKWKLEKKVRERREKELGWGRAI